MNKVIFHYDTFIHACIVLCSYSPFPIISPLSIYSAFVSYICTYDVCVYSYINLYSADKRKNSGKEGDSASLLRQILG